jgi:Zn-dependent M28 family amino/carboxypeptidase
MIKIAIPIILLSFSKLVFAVMDDHYNYPEIIINSKSIQNTVEYLTSIEPSRNFIYISSLNKAASYIEQEFKKSNLQTEVQYFNVSDNIYKNIIATVNANLSMRIIVGAHYDVCGDQPGADDNASAVAGLLEIAKHIKINEHELNCRIDFVAYTLEEPPFFGTPNMGSYVHAKSLKDNNVNVKGMIALEMIGYFSDKPKSQEYPLDVMSLFYPSTGNFIGVVGNHKSASLNREVKRHIKATSIHVESLNGPSFLPGVDFSDHRSYWEFGYDAIMITDTSFYRNPNYHLNTDTIDTLDFNKMKEVIKGVIWALLNIA